jgi:NhaP-type Na+/H+ or K+/H+ antiporter
MTLAGVVLLSMALASAYMRRLPVSSAMLYLALGVALGPRGFGVLSFDALGAAPWFEHLTEIVVVVSLFLSGLHLRLPARDPAWSTPWRLAGPIMVGCIAGVAFFARAFLGLDLAGVVLLGAVLAPTDPVLAGELAVGDANDRDRLRYGLSGEAGLNDGTAFPFVVLALGLAAHGGFGGWIAGWALVRILWAVPAGLAIGFGLGWGLGRLAFHLRTRTREVVAPSDFLALALIALSYVAAQSVGAWGFLATFAAGLGLRRAEVVTVRREPPPPADEICEAIEGVDPHEPPAEIVVERRLRPEALQHAAVASGAVVSEVLSFGDTLERMLEVVVVILVGVLASVHWDPRAIGLAAALFLVIRPLFVALGLIGTPTSRRQRTLMAWFGIRGIGTLYYLTYAITHGCGVGRGEAVARLSLSVVAISIVVHGVTATPVLAWYERAIRRI